MNERAPLTWHPADCNCPQCDPHWAYNNSVPWCDHLEDQDCGCAPEDDPELDEHQEIEDCWDLEEKCWATKFGQREVHDLRHCSHYLPAHLPAEDAAAVTPA